MTPKAVPRPSSAKASPSILVVENHPDMRAGLKTFLEIIGWQAKIVENITSARQAADEGLFDVLLTDISLPDGDGWDLLIQLRRAHRLPPTAIAMSGFGTSSDVSKSEDLGFVKHLIKPFMPEELENILVGVDRPSERGTATKKSRSKAIAA